MHSTDSDSARRRGLAFKPGLVGRAFCCLARQRTLYSERLDYSKMATAQINTYRQSFFVHSRILRNKLPAVTLLTLIDSISAFVNFLDIPFQC